MEFTLLTDGLYFGYRVSTWQNDVDFIIKLFEATSSNSIILVLDILRFDAAGKKNEKMQQR